MTGQPDLGAIARGILDANMYMTLATADEQGRPWASPVYYASEAYKWFFWVSSPEATHSRNVAARPHLSIVVFDSRAPVGTGQGVYMAAHAEELAGDELHRGIEVFSQGSRRHGAAEWKPERVQAPAPHRLYRATVSGHSVLDPAGNGVDRRTPVVL